MATVKFVSYRGGSSHISRTNDYLADGHGDDPLDRTNRYITGSHARGARCVGVNCPSDPALASALMASLRAAYEAGRRGRRTRGTGGKKRAIVHYQIVLSWHTSEKIPAQERYEMGRELIARTPLARFAVLMAAHSNTDEDHLHLSCSAFSLDGSRKLCMNNALLFTLRREMDRICAARGYSIVESPELWGDAAYKQWFDEVKQEGRVVIHPPDQARRRRRGKTTPKAEYAAARAARDPPKRSYEEKDYYTLPYISDPAAPDRALRVCALDWEDRRLPPLVLDAMVGHVWAEKCIRRIEQMPDFAARRTVLLRLGWMRDNTLDTARLLRELDISTRAGLTAHTRAVGQDICRLKQESAYQRAIQEEAAAAGDREKAAKAGARANRTEELLQERQREYRRLKHAAATLERITDPESWHKTRTDLLQTAARRTRRRESADTVRCCFAAMAGLMGVPMEQVEQALPPPRPHPTPEQQARAGQARDDARRQIDAAFAMRRSGLAALYELAGQDIEELRRRRRNRDALLQWTPVLGPAALMLALAYFIACELLQGGAGSEAELERHLAETRRLMEEIHFHNEQIGHCLARAQTLMDLEQAGEDRHAIEAAWAEFDEKCAWLEDRAATLRLQEEALLGEKGIFSGVQTLDRRLREIEARRGERDLALAAEAEYRLCADRPWAAPQHDDPLTYAPMLLDR